MIAGGIERLRRIARWPGNLSGRRFLILLYHQVTELRSDPWSLGVTPRHFAEHLEVLRQRARPIPLQQLSQALLKGNNIPDRSVVITFDDGYANNLYNAKPMLERYGIPVTAFLTTGSMGREREFWWDELDRLLLQPSTLPKAFCLSINGSTYQWELGEATHYSEDNSRHHQSWRAWQDTPSSRHLLYVSLCELLKPLRDAERQKVLSELQEWAGAKPTVRPTHSPLSLEEAFALAQGELVEVGAHTVTHPTLSALPAASQREGIQQSKARLEEILSQSITSFAYPHGMESDYTAETVSIVRESGFARACSVLAAAVEQPADRFQLPRIQVHDWDGEEFAKQLSVWFDS